MHVATLPYWTPTTDNKRHPETSAVINDKSPGSVDTHLGCCEIRNSDIFTWF